MKIPILLALILFALVAPAQQPISIAEADQRAADLFAQSGATGMVLVVVRNHEVLIKGYGETAPNSGIQPDASSLLRLCSVTKVFTGELLAQLAAEGKVKLSDPLQLYAPAHTTVPLGPGNTPITLEDLATHTAALTREVSSYPRKTPHFTFPDQSFRWNWLPTQTLPVPPGTRAVYSNVGFDLLGDALANATHESYAHLLSTRILQPLALYDTTLFPNPGQCARLLQGSHNEGPCTSTEASGPSGGLYSTPTDMARVLDYFLQIPAPTQPGQPKAPTALPILIYHKPSELTSFQGISHAGNPTGIGLAWIQLGDPATSSVILQKTGGGAGFSTYIALSPTRQTGLFLALTDGKKGSQVNPFRTANDLLAALANFPPIEPKPRLAKAAAKKRLPDAHRRRPSAR